VGSLFSICNKKNSKMPYNFADRTQVDRLDDIVFDFAQDGDAPPVRVQASRRFIEAFWKVNWKDDEAVVGKFDHEKRKHVGALKMAEGRTPRLRVYIIG
jgi:hypothetical protein